MTIYVDQLPSSGWGKWNSGAHMLGNDLDELHAMAKRIGLKRSWFQSQSTFAHYDLTASKRALAIGAGAVEIELGEIPDDVLMRCKDGSYELRSERKARREETDAERKHRAFLEWLQTGEVPEWRKREIEDAAVRAAIRDALPRQD